ncbi:hypothetical protein MK805_02200 [Shimazuella sp. AN120528]|uniref:hypothetical protein n=1 Tax=Shimazuella soli TaxID=1892854 RepID=UPI001F10337A|nr:hypothetical protein [Shimazuella soli]MCH5583779.1 hypothetical protein [Shimazuella soli]
MSNDMSNKGNNGDNNQFVRELDFDGDGQRDHTPKSQRKLFRLIAAATLGGVAFAGTAFFLTSRQDTVNLTTSPKPGYSVNITGNSPSASPVKPSKAPTSSTAPQAPVTQEPTEKPVATATPSPKAAKCDAMSPMGIGYASDERHEIKELVRALLLQNMEWNDVYDVTYKFQHEPTETINEVYERFDRDGAERAIYDFRGFYLNSKSYAISANLHAVTGPCKGLAEIDLRNGEKLRASASTTKEDLLQWLAERNTFLKGQAS